MSAPSLQLQPNAVASRRPTIDDDIVELLREAGPLHLATVRTRLSIASESRFTTALFFLIEEGVVERCSGGKESALRLVGDPRPVPETLTRFVQRVCKSRAS